MNELVSFHYRKRSLGNILYYIKFANTAAGIYEALLFVTIFIYMHVCVYFCVYV